MSLDYNFEYYYQVGKRIERIGQKNTMFFYHLLAKTEDGLETIDHDLLEVQKRKGLDRESLFSSGEDLVDIANSIKNRIINRHKK